MKMRVAPLAIFGMLAMDPTSAFAGGAALSAEDRTLLATYARDTWRSVEAIASTGQLPADGIWRNGQEWKPSRFTSPTNIAAYLWSTIAAEGLGLISHDEAGKRLAKCLTAISRLERSHGFFYNWYDPETGERLRNWPGGGPLRGFLSTVDNGWLAASLMMVAQVRPELKAQCDKILGPMNFRFFYDPHDPKNPVAHPGLLRGGYYTDGGGEFTEYHYGTLNTEPRIASYIGIARGDLPADHYYRMARSAPDVSAPVRTIHGVAVTESTRAYRGTKVVPSWDGTMFEALMVPLFVPEAAWSPNSWGNNHRLYAKAQIDYGMLDAKLGYWGISASSDAKGGYHAFGIAPLGLNSHAGINPDGSPPHVVTPHASFLALPFAPREAIDNLKALSATFPVYGPYGFHDAVDVKSGRVSDGVLILDQGMILASIANVLDQDILQQAFSNGLIESSIRPLLAAEQFDATPVAPGSSGREWKQPKKPVIYTASVTTTPATPKPVAAVAPAPAAKRDSETVAELSLFTGPEPRTTEAVKPRRSPIRRRTGKSNERRRSAV